MAAIGGPGTAAMSASIGLAPIVAFALGLFVGWRRGEVHHGAVLRRVWWWPPAVFAVLLVALLLPNTPQANEPPARSPLVGALVLTVLSLALLAALGPLAWLRHRPGLRLAEARP